MYILIPDIKVLDTLHVGTEAIETFQLVVTEVKGDETLQLV